MKVSTRSVSRNNSAQTLQEGAGFGEELNKEKLFKVLKRIAEMEIRESKLVDRIRELEAEIGEETAPPGLGQGSARLI
jgi:formyltetrahydrofolate synthetase